MGCLQTAQAAAVDSRCPALSVKLHSKLKFGVPSFRTQVPASSSRRNSRRTSLVETPALSAAAAAAAGGLPTGPAKRRNSALPAAPRRITSSGLNRRVTAGELAPLVALSQHSGH